jgi:hypothetical protein
LPLFVPFAGKKRLQKQKKLFIILARQIEVKLFYETNFVQEEFAFAATKSSKIVFVCKAES